MMINGDSLSTGRLVELACLLEVSAPKPGNVHRAADFEDTTFDDFVVSAVAIGNVIDRSPPGIGVNGISVGQSIRECVQATKSAVGKNTNLGMILLLCPLAAARSHNGAVSGSSLANVLEGLDATDCKLVYEAIQLAQPGGLNSVDESDVNEESPSDLLKAMSLASERDLIAKQYVTSFEQVFQEIPDWICEGMSHFARLSQAIVFAHVKTMSVFPDSLIQRKNDAATAQHSVYLALKAIDALAEGQEAFWSSVAELDFWLRSDGHRRNPGTTADLIAGGLFVGLANGRFGE